MAAHDLVNWYESSLAPTERKTRGHFSTPPRLVEQILDACGFSPERNLTQLRVLDPACGGGNFLTAVLHRLVLSAEANGLSQRQMLSRVQQNIWGFDPDPVACFMAEMHLREALAAYTLQSPQYRSSLPLHIHQADALTFPWGQALAEKRHADIDLFLANPPYLAAKNTDLSAYRQARGHQGQSDSYLLFLDLALRLVRPGGWIGLVLPDPVLARTNAASERQVLLRETTIHQLWHLSGVFSAFVGAVVIVAQKRLPKRSHQVTWTRGHWHLPSGTVVPISIGSESLIPHTPILGREKPEQAHEHTSMIRQEVLARQPEAELRYLWGRMQGTLIERLYLHSQGHAGKKSLLAPLSHWVTVRRGEELSKDHALLSPWRPNEGEWYPVLRGGVDIHPYRFPQAIRWMQREHIHKPLARYHAPKILVIKSTGQLQASLDLEGHIVLQTLYILNLTREDLCTFQEQEDELFFLLALLNSRLLRVYTYVLHTAYKWVQPQIEQHVLAHLPVPTLAGPERRFIIQRARELQSACSAKPPVVELKEKEMYEELEQAICALYESALQGRRASSSPLDRRIADKGVTYG
ncbi:N-6 DNA methylase [Ktedonobacter robiniae]|uniref:Site-specific DNA-methyltransferase (adenine-specific) n=1 Tax=Ktedonobacter robiniae TaxID=2778365 RepID=A0ABQ3UIZ3_9CHLR|nr:N-6 DNA methylase [Ktedonobacter robiniae]GHO52701.1 hypothetical protein KSB_11760 [Ktedonobacter robiniae]